MCDFMRINSGIFKAYDIRGKYPAELDDNFAYEFGIALAEYFRKKKRVKRPKLIVCRDLRTSSTFLRYALIKGIVAGGGTVLDIGVGTTPFFTYVVNTAKGHQGGVMITASHNPPEYNGFKIRDGKGNAIFSENGLQEIKRLIRKKARAASENEPGIIIETAEYHDKYVKYLACRAKIGELSAVIDAGGGSTTLFLPKVLTQFPRLVYKPLFFDPDGSFERHPPNPLLPEAQKFVQEEISKNSYRLGILFDGDGDRVLFFDERGIPVKAEFILGLLAERLLQKKPGSAFVLPVNTSRGAREFIMEKGGKVKLSKIGYVYVERKMKKTKSPLAAEISGHFHYQDFFWGDAGILTALFVMELLSQTTLPLSRLVEPMQRYISSGEISFKVSEKNKLIHTIKKEYTKFGAHISLLDGISVEFPEWWFNLRPSNTEPLIRLVLEAKTRKLLQEKLGEVKEIIKQY